MFAKWLYCRCKADTCLPFSAKMSGEKDEKLHMCHVCYAITIWRAFMCSTHLIFTTVEWIYPTSRRVFLPGLCMFLSFTLLFFLYACLLAQQPSRQLLLFTSVTGSNTLFYWRYLCLLDLLTWLFLYLPFILFFSSFFSLFFSLSLFLFLSFSHALTLSSLLALTLSSLLALTLSSSLALTLSSPLAPFSLPLYFAPFSLSLW